jgi:AcrR family transcriptional regulator
MAVDRRKQIVDAAGKSFSLFGYKATTMDQVAKLANVGKGTIYTFFANKEDLFGEILGDVIDHLKALAEQSFNPQQSFSDNLHRYLFAVLEFRQQHEFMIRLTHEMTDIGTPEAVDGMRKIESAILLLLADQIRPAIDSGELKPCDPERTAFVIFKLYIALIFDWQTTHPPLEKEEIAEMFDLYIIKGLSVL